MEPAAGREVAGAGTGKPLDICDNQVILHHLKGKLCPVSLLAEAEKARMSKAAKLPAAAKIGRGQLTAVCKLPAGEVLTTGALGQRLPENLPLATVEQEGEAVQLLMLGPLSMAHVNRFCQPLPSIREAALTGKAATPDSGVAVQELLEAVNFSMVHSLLDPFCGWGVAGTCFAEQGLSVLSNDLNARRRADYHEDALDPGFYRRHPAQAVVASPPPSLLDLAMPLMAASADAVACVHVPGFWVNAAHASRRR